MFEGRLTRTARKLALDSFDDGVSCCATKLTNLPLYRKIPWRLSAPQKGRQRKRLRAVDRVVAVVDAALARKGLTASQLLRWKEQMPSEAEMFPRDKYTMFDRKERRYRKGIHSKLWLYYSACLETLTTPFLHPSSSTVLLLFSAWLEPLQVFLSLGGSTPVSQEAFRRRTSHHHDIRRLIPCVGVSHRTSLGLDCIDSNRCRDVTCSVWCMHLPGDDAMMRLLRK